MGVVDGTSRSPLGQVKLLDFGIARTLGPDPAKDDPLTRTGMLVMTPACASPEQVRGAALSTASVLSQRSSRSPSKPSGAATLEGRTP